MVFIDLSQGKATYRNQSVIGIFNLNSRQWNRSLRVEWDNTRTAFSVTDTISNGFR
jgi:hypothetical protein